MVVKAASRRASPVRKSVLLVEDHPLMREGIAQWIQRAPDLEVCGMAGDTAEALDRVETLKPDIVLLDVSLPGRSGLEFIKDLGAVHPELPILVLSMHDQEIYASRALRAGARGYLMKTVGGQRVIQGIREVLAGRIVLCPGMATQLLEEYAGRPRRSSVRPLQMLTDREFEVLLLVGEARSIREIGTGLNLSPKTVETHRMKLMKKLKLRTAHELLRFAIQYLESEGSVSPATTPEAAPAVSTARPPGRRRNRSGRPH